MTEPSERETKDQESIGEAINEFVEFAIRNRDGLPDFWCENNTTERLAEHLVPLLATAREEGRREAIEECAKIADGADQLIEDCGPVKFISPEKFASDMAKDIADGIRALAGQPTATPTEPNASTAADTTITLDAAKAREAFDRIEVWVHEVGIANDCTLAMSTAPVEPSDAEVEAAAKAFWAVRENQGRSAQFRAALVAAAKVRAGKTEP